MTGRHHTGRVTPKDIKAAIKEAVARGGDREQLEQQYRDLAAELGGEERLAERWTMANLKEDYREQINPFAAPAPQPPAGPRSEDDKQRLARLIRDNPKLARDLLDKQPPE